MAIDIDAIGITVDTRQVKNASRDLDSLGKSADNASRKADGLSDSSNKVTSSFGAMGRLLPALGLTALATGFIRASDSMIKMNAQLKIATRSQEEFNEASKNVAEIAKRSQSELGAIGTTYARLSNSLRDMGATQKQVSNVTETLALSLKVNGATAAETTSTMLQLSQAFGKGKLDGDEFRTAMEAAPNVMRELAKAIGVPFGALKDLAAQGGLTSEVMLKAFNNPELLGALREQAKATETVNGAWQVFMNSLTLSLAKINEMTGATTILIGVLNKAATLLSVFRGGEDGSILRNFLDSGNKSIADKAAAMSTGELKQAAQWYGWAKDALKARQALNDNMQLGGMSPNGTISPNFAAAIQSQDINKIHQQQEEQQRKLEESQRKYKEIYNERLTELQREVDEETDNLDSKNKYQIGLEKETASRKKEQMKEFAEMDKKFNDVIQGSADKRYRAEQSQIEKLAKQQEEAARDINRSLTDALLRGFEDGKGFAKNFRDTVINMFKTLVLRPTISAIIDGSGLTKLIAGITAALSGTAVAGDSGAGSGGGFGALLSQGKTLYEGITNGFGSLNNSFIEGIAGFGTTLRGFGFDSFGTLIENNSTMLGNLAPYAGAALSLIKGDFKGAAFQGAGAFIGNLIVPGLGGVVGAFLGGAIGGLFGGKKQPPRTAAVGSASFNNGLLTQSNGKLAGRTSYDAGMGGTLQQVSAAYTQSVGGLLSAFGLGSNASASTSYSGRGGGSGYGNFNASVNGVGTSINEKYKDGFGEATFNQFINKVLGEGIVKGIQSSALSAGVKKFFDGLTKKEDVAEAINTLVGLKSALIDLPPIFNAVTNAIDTTKYKTAIDQLKAQFSAIGTYTGLFYSEQENFDTFAKQLTTQFGALNIAIPSTRDGFRALVDGISVVDGATRDQFNGLVALAPAMDKYYQYLQQQGEGINQVNAALAEGLDKNLYSTFADYASAQANVSAGMADTYMAQLNSPSAMNETLIAEIKSLRAENADLKTVMEAVAKNTYDTAKVQKQWNGDGLPETRIL